MQNQLLIRCWLIKELAKNDTLLPQIAYYATLAADRVGDKDAIIKYAPSALSDKDGGKFAMQLMADAYKAKGDTAAWIKSLEEGILKFPGNDYFFANLVRLLIILLIQPTKILMAMLWLKCHSPLLMMRRANH